MDDLIKFVFQNDGDFPVRAFDEDGEYWFVGKDVADVLGYTNSRKAIADHVDEEDRGVTKRDTLGGNQEMTIINESGLYSLILSSKLPSAKKFKRWVTSEVLPALRKHGEYHLCDMLPTDQQLYSDELDGINNSFIAEIQLDRSGKCRVLPQSMLIRRYQKKLPTESADLFLLNFIEPCSPKEGAIPTAEFYEKYKHWCELCGFEPVSRHVLYERLCWNCSTCLRTIVKGRSCYVGIAVKTQLMTPHRLRLFSDKQLKGATAFCRPPVTEPQD